MISYYVTIMGNLYDVTQLTKLGAVNTQCRPALFSQYANVSDVTSELLFTPLWRARRTEKSILTQNGILRESKVYLRDLIINRHVLVSPIEKSRAFWSGRQVRCR